jgi:hypothetical protein
MNLWLCYALLLSLTYSYGMTERLTQTEAQLAHCFNGGTFKNGNDAMKCVDTIYERGN